MAKIWSTPIIHLLLTQYYLLNGVVGSGDVQKFSNFTCHDGNGINYVEVCDGESNCADGSDETGCDSNGILFYYVYNKAIPVLSHDCQRYNDPFQYSSTYTFEQYCYNSLNYYGFMNMNIIGIYLNENEQFSIPILNKVERLRYHISWEEEFKLQNVQIGSNGPRLNVLFTDRNSNNFLKQATRAGSVENTQNVGHPDNIKSLVVDWVTSNLYFISKSTIKVCDQNFVICVTALSSKFLRNPILIAISPKHRLLFWIEKLSPQIYHLYKYAIDMSSKIKRISQALKAPRGLTIDSAEERVYWLNSGDGKNVTHSVYSITFEGTDLEAITGTSESITSFSVFDNTLYFSSNKLQPLGIWKCSVDDCNQPTLFKQVNSSVTPSVTYIQPQYGYEYKSEIGSLTIDHRLSPTNKIQDECTRSSCSHWCLLDSEMFFNCYCEGSEKPLSARTNNGFCEDATLIVAHKNQLYVVGIFNNVKFTPRINKTTLPIKLISTVTYDSLKGNVILTETERQKIYSWIPRTGELIPLLDDGLGTVKSMEFDNYANNLYWIDPVNFVIKVMNLNTRLKVIILEGDSTYLPIELTLAPAKGYMFVQFLKNTSTIVLERISMDGKSVRIPIHVDKEIEDIGNLHLHYMRETEMLYLLDRQRNKIGYFLDEKSEFQDLTYSDSTGKVQSIVSLNASMIWFEDDLVIRRGKVDTSEIVLTQNISLIGLPKDGDDTLKVEPVVKSVVQPRLAKCLRDNGGCEELCLVTEKGHKFVCACTENKILVDGRACRSSEIVSESVTNENTAIFTSSSTATTEINRNKGSTSTKRTEDVTDKKEQHRFQNETTCIQSCPTLHCPIAQCPILQCPPCERVTESPLTKQNFSISSTTLQKNETNCVESCPVCQQTVQQSSTYLYHIFNSIFIAILATLFGFTLGYLFHRSFSQHSNARFHEDNRNVEMSQMRQAESITTLSSKGALVRP